MIQEFARKLGTQMIHFVPRDNMVHMLKLIEKQLLTMHPSILKPTNTAHWQRK
jgi:nitrogenase iron protein NifH